MEQYLLDYIKSSEAERQLLAAILGKTQQQILREIELEQFYENADNNFLDIRYVDFRTDPVELHVTFYQISFHKMDFKSRNARYPVMSGEPVMKTIIFQENDIRGNDRLMNILRKWESYQQQLYVNFIQRIAPKVVQQIQKYFYQNVKD